jgi:vacuolar protein sorting-associated protein 35
VATIMASKRRTRGAANPADDDNERFLHEAKQQVARHAWKMKLAKDELGTPGTTRQEVTKNVMKCATDMLMEMRTGLLTPRNYYALYNDVTMQLFEFESFVSDVHEAGTPLEELYSLVQACSGNIVPRLYLLITTGAVYIKSKEITANQILKDLVEMTKGVQHPMRGLFLRYYLSHMTKDKLPDIGTEYESEGGNIEDAIDFVLQNFVEMNKLWVRMQHQRKREKSQAKRETERQALKSVVGTNLMRLAKMNGLDVTMYQTTVLPRLLEQITNCKDKIAQEYLMDCLVQVFPDSFHLATLEDFLQTCTQLKPEVDVANIIKNLMRRLSRDGDGAAAIPSTVNAFQIFTDFVHRVIMEKSSMALPTIIGLQLALEQFALKNYPGRLDYVDNVLSFCAQFMEKAVGSRDRLDSESSALVLELLSKPLETLALNVLHPDLAHYTPLTEFLLWDDRKVVALALLERVLATYDGTLVEEVSSADAGDDSGVITNVLLNTDVTVGKLLTFLRPLIKDESDTPTDEQTRGDFVNEQRLVARLVHLFHTESTDDMFRIYLEARRHFGHGGTRRIQFTLVPLVFRALELTHRVRQLEVEGGSLKTPARKVFQFIHEIVTALASKFPEVSLRLFLQSAIAADRNGASFKPICYEFVSQAFI